MKHLVVLAFLLLLIPDAHAGGVCGTANTPDPRPNGSGWWNSTLTSVPAGCRLTSGYNIPPSVDHDNNANTNPRCFNPADYNLPPSVWNSAQRVDQYGITWVVLAAGVYPDHTNEDPHITYCINYFKLPDRYCTGTGVPNSGRLVYRYGSTSLTYQSIDALKSNPDANQLPDGMGLPQGGWETNNFCAVGGGSGAYPQGTCPAAYGGNTNINYQAGTANLGCCKPYVDNYNRVWMGILNPGSASCAVVTYSTATPP